MAATELIFYGGGGHAKVVIESWLASGGLVAGVFDDDASLQKVLDHKVVGKYDAGFKAKASIVITVGNNRVRKTLVEMVKHSFGKVQHPSVILSATCAIGQGTVIMPGAIISSSSVIGAHAIVNHKSCVDHDCIVADYVHLAPGSTICGDVSIGEGTLVGAGATVMPGVRIGKWATVGAGSVVSQNVPDFAIAVGVPARVVRYVENQGA
jgi:sugar O-acyltransferase (sialic acid O-acetyltransferase NeuD family)